MSDQIRFSGKLPQARTENRGFLKIDLIGKVYEPKRSTKEKTGRLGGQM
jgi:hypothetical protein